MQPAPTPTSSAFPMLGRFLSMQPLAQELLLPTPTNVSAVYLPADAFLSFVAVQQWCQQHLQEASPQLLAGSFVLVPTAALSNIQQAAAIPWRLRQVSAVEWGPLAGIDPAAATVVLVGGDRVAAGSISSLQLQDARDYQYLCCELAALQQTHALPPLKVYDVAHVAWRTKMCVDLEAALANYRQEQAELSAAGYDAEVLQQAGQGTLDLVRGTLRRLPPLDWVSTQILQFVELNPCAPPASPDQLLSAGQYNQLLQDAAAAWRQYTQCMAAGQPPPPVLDLVPCWAGLEESDGEPEEGADNSQQAAAAGIDAAQLSTRPPAGTSHLQPAYQGAPATPPVQKPQQPSQQPQPAPVQVAPSGQSLAQRLAAIAAAELGMGEAGVQGQKAATHGNSLNIAAHKQQQHECCGLKVSAAEVTHVTNEEGEVSHPAAPSHNAQPHVQAATATATATATAAASGQRHKQSGDRGRDHSPDHRRSTSSSSNSSNSSGSRGRHRSRSRSHTRSGSRGRRSYRGRSPSPPPAASDRHHHHHNSRQREQEQERHSHHRHHDDSPRSHNRSNCHRDSSSPDRTRYGDRDRQGRSFTPYRRSISPYSDSRDSRRGGSSATTAAAARAGGGGAGAAARGWPRGVVGHWEDRLRREFAGKSQWARLPLQAARDCMPPALATFLRNTNGQMTLASVMHDHMPFEVVEVKGSAAGAMFVQRAEHWRHKKVCSYWRPEEVKGCYWGSRCNFRHDLPARLM